MGGYSEKCPHCPKWFTGPGIKDHIKAKHAPCKTCKSVGFDKSVLGDDRCTFCDGTEGGNPPQLFN